MCALCALCRPKSGHVNHFAAQRLRFSVGFKIYATDRSRLIKRNTFPFGGTLSDFARPVSMLISTPSLPASTFMSGQSCVASVRLLIKCLGRRARSREGSLLRRSNRRKGKQLNLHSVRKMSKFFLSVVKKFYGFLIVFLTAKKKEKKVERTRVRLLI